METMEILLGEDDQCDMREVREWKRFGTQLFISILTHPLDYARVLMQLGYEPVQPHLGFNMMGSPQLLLPNIFEYSNYIRKTDGFIGCYRGLMPKLLGTILGTVCSQSLAELLSKSQTQNQDRLASGDSELNQFKANMRRDVLVSVTSTVISQPFTVISIRMMAQFVGHEVTYNSILNAIMEIYQCEGYPGFFAGLIPKLIWNTGALILTSTTIYLLNRYLIGKNKLMRQYNMAVVPIVYSTLLYPFQVVSTCAAVSGAHITAGRPPLMPIYDNWRDCMKDLYERNAFSRGRSPFRRTTIGVDMAALRRLKAAMQPPQEHHYVE